MKKLMLILSAVFLMTQFGLSQDTQQERKLTKAEKKAQKKIAQMRQHEVILALVESQNFVIEANRLTDRYGNTIFLNPSINFISLIDSTSTIQLALDGAIRGSNGLGGFTVDSDLQQFKIVEDRFNKGVRFNLRVFGSALGSADVRVDLNHNGLATATINTLRGGRFTLQGVIVPLEESSVYKGTTIF